MDLDDVFKAQRSPEITRGMHARPAHPRIYRALHHRKSKRTVKAMLSHLHEPKEIRIVHDPRHIGVTKFHHAADLKFVRHTAVCGQVPRFPIEFRPAWNGSMDARPPGKTGSRCHHRGSTESRATGAI